MNGLANSTCNVILLLSIYFIRYLNDLFVLDIGSGHTLQWEMPTQYGSVPSPRESHTAAACTNPDGSKPRLIVYGGMSGCRLGDLYQLDIGKLSIVVTYIRSFNAK